MSGSFLSNSGFEPTAITELYTNKIQSIAKKGRINFCDERLQGVSSVGRGKSTISFSKDTASITASAPIRQNSAKMPTDPQDITTKQYVDTPVDLSVNQSRTFRNFLGEIIFERDATTPSRILNNLTVTNDQITLSTPGTVAQVDVVGGANPGKKTLTEQAPGSGEVQVSYTHSGENQKTAQLTFNSGDSVGTINVVLGGDLWSWGNQVNADLVQSIPAVGIPGYENTPMKSFPAVFLDSVHRTSTGGTYSHNYGIDLLAMVDLQGNNNPGDRRVMVVSKRYAANGTNEDNDGNTSQQANFDAFNIRNHQETTDVQNAHWWDNNAGTGGKGLENSFYFLSDLPGLSNQSGPSHPIDLERLLNGGAMPLTNDNWGSGFPNAKLVKSDPNMLDPNGVYDQGPEGRLLPAIWLSPTAAGGDTRRTVTAALKLEVDNTLLAEASTLHSGPPSVN
jgi:hypothetical protein